MLDFCLRLFCPGPGRRQKKERYINPASLALSRPRRRYPLPIPVYPLPAPILPPPEQNYEQPRPISSIYYPEPDLEFGPESEPFHRQRFQRVPLDPDLRHRFEPTAQRVHFVEPEQEVYLPLPRTRSPPRQHIHFVQQLSPPYIPSPPPSPTTHHIHVLPPPTVLPAPRQSSPPHTHVHLLGPVPPRIATPPAQALALVAIPKVKRTMNFPNHPHHHHNHIHNHNHRHRSLSSSPSRSPSPFSHAHNPPQNHANNQQNNPSNLNNIPLADLIRDVLHRYLQINLPPGTAISIARLMSNSRNPTSNLSNQANAGTVRNRSRSPSQGRGQGRGRRGGNNNNGNGNGAANGNAVGSGRRGDGGNRQAVMSSDSSSDSSDPPRHKSIIDFNEEIRRVNMCAQVANGIISPSMLNAEVHPKLDTKGQYPKGFQRPLKVRDFMAMDTKNLDALLITYDLSRVTHHSSDLAALSIFRAHNERNQNTTNHGTRNPPCDCTVCALVHEDQREARREILFEYLCVGALHSGSGVANLLALGLGHAQGQSHGQAQAQQAQVQLTRAGGVLMAGNPRGGGRHGGGGNQGANANANANAAGYLILPQPGHAMQVQNVQGAVPNRLNNNNIGLAQPSQHSAHSHHQSQQHLGGGGSGNGQGGVLQRRS
ncbi:hypothetical protein BCIN_03g08460 [Botrytis cinerea B05.10]|uniref:Uncharacterized protein n=1 Tax=Botryotinia fuckeliana (strain B05.10) TaxID=332648 RepID=A0A384JDJ0_BOTFB|nr:hypothetical protein BCIN_03g08460 [Botrytis cinerea B05.10]ATZ48656.1 hypothetical protein BCIN_03g08460 [Botrytis cinerea B05.10]